MTKARYLCIPRPFVSAFIFVACAAFLLRANAEQRNDSVARSRDSSFDYSSKAPNASINAAKINRYSYRGNMIAKWVWPILGIRASYPYLISLETGVILNLTALQETDLRDPVNGPAIFTEIGYPGIIAGCGANFGRLSNMEIAFVRPEICYSRVWANQFDLRSRGQYVGAGITGSFRLAKASLRVFSQFRGRNPRGYLAYFGFGFGI